MREIAILGHDYGYGLADVADFVAGQHGMFRDLDALDLPCGPGWDVAHCPSDIAGGQHCYDTRQRTGWRGIERPEARVCVRTTQHDSV